MLFAAIPLKPRKPVMRNFATFSLRTVRRDRHPNGMLNLALATALCPTQRQAGQQSMHFIASRAPAKLELYWSRLQLPTCVLMREGSGGGFGFSAPHHLVA